MLLIAAQLPFRRILGVGFASELHDLAVNGMQRGRADDPMLELVRQDPAESDFPRQPPVLYFNNAFLPPVMRTVMQRLAESLGHPRPSHLVLFAPAGVQQKADALGFRAT